MKKLIVSLICVAMLFSLNAYAATTNCQPLKAISIIANEGVSSGGQVIFRNVGTTATCGTSFAPNTTRDFALPSATADKAMALILTGISLGKTFVMWADYDAKTISSISMEDQ